MITEMCSRIARCQPLSLINNRDRGWLREERRKAEETVHERRDRGGSGGRASARAPAQIQVASLGRAQCQAGLVAAFLPDVWPGVVGPPSVIVIWPENARLQDSRQQLRHPASRGERQ